MYNRGFISKFNHIYDGLSELFMQDIMEHSKCSDIFRIRRALAKTLLLYPEISSSNDELLFDNMLVILLKN